MQLQIIPSYTYPGQKRKGRCGRRGTGCVMKSIFGIRFFNKNKKLKTLKNTRLSASLKAGDERIELYSKHCFFLYLRAFSDCRGG
jgi:CRISPR/Cas system-associated endonuclease/helicase Cas3